MKILAIDTSCDDTSVSLSDNDRILSNVISSQIELHKKWGGVVPVIAKRNHEEQIDFVIEKACKIARISLAQIDIFAVTIGPGLAMALEVGVKKIKELSQKFQKKVVGVNHMVGHIYANFSKNSNGKTYSGLSNNQSFPLLVLLISGGHTEFVLMKNHMDFEKIGQTLDDSVGEAFDKVANMLGWGYPGGPIIEKFARESGGKDKFNFPLPMKDSKNLNMSYSGLKTAVLRIVKEVGAESFPKINELEITDPRVTISKKPFYNVDRKTAVEIAYSFQKAAAFSLAHKLDFALEKFKVSKVLIGGGVSNNTFVRNILGKTAKEHNAKLFYPKNKKLLTDNAGMIATAAYYMASKNQFANTKYLDRDPSLSF